MPDERNIQDLYNRPAANVPEYDDFVFSDLENDDLFWRTNVGVDTQPHRKTGVNEALNLKSREIVTIPPRTKVYVKV